MQGGFGNAYKTQGVDNFYTKEGSTYSNPHEYDIERLLRLKFTKKNDYITVNSKILDLACGSGEITLILKKFGYKNIQGIDPYTFEAYEKRTGLKCEKYTFVDIVHGALDDRKYDAIIISYALHLVKDSMLYQFCQKLIEISKTLIVVAPHKFPIMKDHYGWKEVQSLVKDKIHLRIFKPFSELTKLSSEQEELLNQSK